ncbi:MAG: methyltransferase domain-containing protein [Sphingomonadaceae bacterium]|nr:methyltransferase domain-containing protein [Sphingomonadaceae bacterium]
MQVDWEEADCDFCGGSDGALYLESDVPSWYDGRPLRLVECSTCKMVRATPRPVAEQLYEDFMTDAPFAKTVTDRKRARPDVDAKHALIVERAMEHRPEATSLYDFGCGAGTLLEAAHDKGLRVGGNDLNWYSTQQLGERGFAVEQCFNHQVDTAVKYDIVTALDIIEHSYTPFGDLKIMYEKLKPGGILYAKTLYLDSPTHIDEGEAWHLYGAGHFSYFTTPVLVAMIEAAGFEIVKVREYTLVTIIARKPETRAIRMAKRVRRIFGR